MTLTREIPGRRAYHGLTAVATQCRAFGALVAKPLAYKEINLSGLVISPGQQKVRVQGDSGQYPYSDLDHRGNRLW